MITFSGLGHNGKLGNQMFQYACLYSIAKKNGYDFSIPSTSLEWKNVVNYYNSRMYLLDIFNISARVEPPIKQIHNTCVYNDAIFNPQLFTIQDNTDISGYFQSEKYFEHCAEDIRCEFSFKNKELLADVDREFETLPTKIGIHVRRGDYVKYANVHPLCTLEYYKEAVRILRETCTENPILYVFSDDINWCKANFTGQFSEEIIYDEEPESGERYFTHQEKTMMKMSKCDKIVIANSSYSWWGAWLGNKKEVIAPTNWFGDKPFNEFSDIFASGWKVIY